MNPVPLHWECGVLTTAPPGKSQDTRRLKVKGWKKIFQANRNDKKAGVAILISDKVDFKVKTIKKDKEGHYIMIKGSIQVEDITSSTYMHLI